jgi:hypothetical protein
MYIPGSANPSAVQAAERRLSPRVSSAGRWILRRASGGLLCALAALILSAPLSARAAQVSVGLLGIDGASVEPGMGQALTDALRKHLPSLPNMRVEMKSQDLSEVKLVFGCTDEKPACMAKVGRSLGVDRLIFGSIRKLPQATTYTVSLKQLNVVDSTIEKYITEAVPAEALQKDSPQLHDLVGRWLPALLNDTSRGGFRILTDPPGASVQLDGVPLGQTPLAFAEVEIGEHSVRIEKPGFPPIVRTITVRGGQSDELFVNLQNPGEVARGAAPTQAPTEKGGSLLMSKSLSRGLRIGAFVAAGIAGVAAISAIGTWRAYSSAQDAASMQLNPLYDRLLGNGTLSQYTNFFGSSQALSTCAPVATLMGDANYQGYLSECRRGNSLASATTGLWVVTGVFGALSLTAGLLSSLRTGDVSDSPSKPGKPDSTPPSGGAQPGPRLVSISPVVSPEGVAATATVRF